MIPVHRTDDAITEQLCARIDELEHEKEALARQLECAERELSRLSQRIHQAVGQAMEVAP